MFEIKSGLRLPISGTPQQKIHKACPTRSVAVLGSDYCGLKPQMAIQEGDAVRIGQVLFEDKKKHGLLFTSPACGTVSAINRGNKRSLISVVIDVNDDEEYVNFRSYTEDSLQDLDAREIRAGLVESGLWTAFRGRPFSCVPALDSDSPAAIFVTAIDTNPLAADPRVVLAEYSREFTLGLQLMSKLTDGQVFVCSAPETKIDLGLAGNIRQEEFSGVHPAGLVGTHIHFLFPVSTQRSVWHIDYQDVIAVAKLFLTGRLWIERIISIGGPPVDNPRLLQTRLGANLEELATGETMDTEVRLISGSVFSGHRSHGTMAFLGRYHRQLSIIREDRSRNFLGYLSLGANKHSVLSIYLSSLSKLLKFLPQRMLDISTTTNGSPRGLVPTGSYERVMPLDILPTQLLLALLTNDIDTAIELGCLELDEEDLALCTYACPSKYEYGPVLRSVLTKIQQEG